MAPQLLRVLLLCTLAVAADESSVQWWSGGHTWVRCEVPGSERLQRRPPLPIDAADDFTARPYSWRHDDEEISYKRISSNGSLEIFRRKSGGVEGTYQCSVKHNTGTVLGYPVSLKLSYIEKQFTSQPEDRTVTAGQPVAFSCVISSAPEANITWLKDGVPVNNTRFYVLKNQLLILDTRLEDAGVYRCTATNSYINKIRSSHKGQLVVSNRSPDLRIQVSSLPLQVEGSVVVARGGRVELPCPFIGWPRPEMVWELTSPGGRTGELEFTGECLTLPSVQLDQEGVYTCKPQGFPELVKTFNVTISEPVTITAPPKSKQVLRASTVRFSCIAEGKPSPSVTWYKDGELLSMVGRTKLLKSATDDNINLVISSVTSEDAGIYQCFVSNQVSSASAWAELRVEGTVATAPAQVSCAAIGADRVIVTWTHPQHNSVFAYTLHTLDEDGTSWPGQPHTDTEEKVTLKRALTPYTFQVRAYITAVKNIASDMSETQICQGQGVPIKLRKVEGGILVSWQEFSTSNPGVMEWILQYRPDASTVERNVTLPGHVQNYTLISSAPMQIRVLGSRSKEWLLQNLTLVPWTSSDDATTESDDGVSTCSVTDLEATQVSSTWVSFSWKCEERSASRISYIVCLKRQDSRDICQESDKNLTTVVGLSPDSDYSARVQARLEGRALGGAFSEPLYIRTPHTKSDRFKDITYRVVNATAVLVSWGGGEGNYKVQYSTVLRLPVDVWNTGQGFGNSVYLTDLDGNEDTYVIVTDLESGQNSRVLTIPKMNNDNDINDLQYKYSGEGGLVFWSTGGSFIVRYAQELSTPLDKWTEVVVNDTQQYLEGLDPKSYTYVMVQSTVSDKSKVLTIPPPPPPKTGPFSPYYALAIAFGVLLLVVALVAVLCCWQRRKRRRRELNVQGAAELKEMTILSNGGTSRGAGEPLLNGHLLQDSQTQIVPKTPNGKIRKNRQYEAAFDVSRYSDPNSTLDTVVEADISVESRHDTPDTSRTLLDTSRRQEFDLNTKLPDDNMNSQVTSDYRQKGKRVTPTLQPNG